MAITMMCKADEPGARGPYDEHGRETTPDAPGHKHWLHTFAVGMVLSLSETNGYDDSDFHATVWNADKGEPERITYASTRGWTYANGANVDATPEVLAAYEAWRVARDARIRKEREEAEAKQPRKGKRVRVVGGRGPKGHKGPWQGQEAEVFWRGADKFARSGQSALSLAYFGRFEDNDRVGLRFADGTKAFTSVRNVEVIQG